MLFTLFGRCLQKLISHFFSQVFFFILILTLTIIIVNCCFTICVHMIFHLGGFSWICVPSCVNVLRDNRLLLFVGLRTYGHWYWCLVFFGFVSELAYCSFTGLFCLISKNHGLIHLNINILTQIMLDSLHWSINVNVQNSNIRIIMRTLINFLFTHILCIWRKCIYNAVFLLNYFIFAIFRRMTLRIWRSMVLNLLNINRALGIANGICRLLL